MKKLLSMLLSLILGLDPIAGWNGGEDAPAPDDRPSSAQTEQAPEPSPKRAQQRPDTDDQAPGTTTTKDKLLPVDHIDGNSVLTVEDDVYYEFDDHGYMSVGLDGTLIPYDVYYGICVTVVNDKRLDLTWHNYSDMDVEPTTATVRNLYTGKSNVGKMDAAEGEAYVITKATPTTGPYVVEVAWDNGVTTPVYFYSNGGDLYTCQAAEESSKYICRWYDRKDTIDNMLAAAGITPENALDYSDSYWAYPVPADYGEGYRCDNSRWIDLAEELTTEDMSDAQKAVVIHDWMTANLVYDYYKVNTLHKTRAAYHNDYSGKYSMWDTGVGVCADFTTVYCIMLRSLGIPAVSLDRNNEHVWNIVYLDGDWVEIDLTDDIDRGVYGKDVTDVVRADDTIDYGAFGTPFSADTITPGYHNINHGIYSYSYVVNSVWS